MKTFLLTLLAVLAIVGEAAKSAGCGKAAGIQSGSYSINVNGKQRQYIVRVPQNYNPNTAYSLIFSLHWRGGSMQSATQIGGGYYGLQAQAKESAIFVSPQGFDAGWANSGGQDIALIDALVEKMDKSLCVNQNLRFSVGWSYGASMSYAIACARADKFRGVALFSGAQLSGCDGGNKPIAFWSTHGTHDDVLPISMGRALRDHYVKVNGCTNQNAPEPGSGGGYIKTEYKGCSSGHPVWWYAHSGGHTGEPGSWAPVEIWKFFTQFDSSTTPEPTTESPQPTSATPQPEPTTTKPPASDGAALYGQCGGNNWTGPTTCAQGHCAKMNDWYSQCVP